MRNKTFKSLRLNPIQLVGFSAQPTLMKHSNDILPNDQR